MPNLAIVERARALSAAEIAMLIKTVLDLSVHIWGRGDWDGDGQATRSGQVIAFLWVSSHDL